MSPALINGLGGTEGFGENTLFRNDDGSSSAIDVTSVFGNGLNFFGHTYTALYLNNNGNITLSGPLSTFTPGPITAGLGNPIIAAFWADVDTRGGPGVPTGGNATGSNTVYWDLDTANHVFTATWDDVGYYSAHVDKLDAFQLRLIDEGGGNFDIEFRYQAINWTTGDASGGSRGLGGTSARAGFSAGDGIHVYELPQSGNQNALLGLPSNPAPPATHGVTGETGIYRFQVRNGVIVPPAPAINGLVQDGDGSPPTGTHTTDTTPTITGTGVSGDTITVLVDGTAAGTGTVQSDGTWRIELGQLAVAQHNITATQSDPAGTVSPPSSPLAITIESTREPPPAPTGLSLSPDSDTGQLGDNVTSDATPAITGTGVSGDTITVLVDGTAAGTRTVQSDGTWRIELGQLAVAQHNITATQSDPAGTVSPPSSPLAITIESTREPPPAPTGLSLSPDSDAGQLGDNVTSDATPAITGTGVSGDTITVLADGTAAGAGTVQSDGTWRIELGQLAVAQHNITATQSDPAGTVSPPSSPLAITITALPGPLPAPTLTNLALSPVSDSGKAGDNRTNDATPTINGDGGISGDIVTLRANGVEVGTGTVAADGTWQVTAGVLTDGVYSLTATQTDLVGTTSLASATLFVTIDTSAPDPGVPSASPTELSVPNNAGPTAIGILAPSDPDDPAASLSIVVTTLPTNGTVTLSDGTPVTVGQSLSIAQLTQLKFAPTAGMIGVSSSLGYSVTDVAGNGTNGSATLTVGAKGPPAPSSLALASSSDSGVKGDNVTNIAAPTITGTGEAGATVTLLDGSTVVATATVLADSTWSATSKTLSDGVHGLTATEKDSGGLVSGPSSILSITIDLGVPAASPTKLTVPNNAGPTAIGILAPSDPDDPAASLSIVVTTLPTNGTVTLSDGTPVTVGQSLSIAQLTQLKFAPTAGMIGVSSSLGYSVTDVAGNGTNGSATLTVGAKGPPAPSSLALASSSDSGVKGDNVTNIAAPTITGTGEAGATVTLLDGSTVVATATVLADSTWSATSKTLSDGVHGLTATEKDSGGLVSGPSSILSITIDLGVPAASPTKLTVPNNAGLTAIGILAPSDPDDPAASLSIAVTTLPTNGTVTLSDGTPVTVGQSLSIAQLTQLKFAPAAGMIGVSSNLVYNVSDVAANATTGSAALTVGANSSTGLFDFLFTYNDGKDYYGGSVADEGSFGYVVGQTIATSAGQYSIFANEGSLTSQTPGTVIVAAYSHNGPGAASPTPIGTASGTPDGTKGLGSESDAVLGVDGNPHPFSSTVEASFPTTNLFGFVYTYADGAAVYTGSVADDGSAGLADGSLPVTDGSGHVIGTYTIFSEGVTGRPAGSVVIDRFIENGQSFVPVHANSSGIDGIAGLTSEAATIVAQTVSLVFSDTVEPVVSGGFTIAPVTPAPDPGDVISQELNEIYHAVLGRDPDPTGLALYSAELASGTNAVTIRATLAGSAEAQHDINQLYRQLLGHDADTTGLSTYTNYLATGGSLAGTQLSLAQSPEAQNAIGQIYLDVLNRPVDPAGLATDTVLLGNERPDNLADPGGRAGLDGLRDIIAHSPEAAASLTALFQGVLGRPPGAAELIGMEDELVSASVSQTTVKNALVSTGTAGGFSVVTAPSGAATLPAAFGVPTLFVFSDITFGNDTITGFDTLRDTIQLSKATVGSFTTLQSETTSSGGGSLITLNSSQLILISGVPPAKLSSANFLFV